MIEALLYEKLENHKVRCLLCGHKCVIPAGDVGVCQVRRNDNGTLTTLIYGSVISQNVDPIEKKPLYHFYPGSRAFSIAAPGCNFQCQWCQNWQIAQMPRLYGMLDVEETTPGQIVERAQATNSRSIAYTYTEPTVFFEYTYETAKLAHQASVANVYVTNGYMSSEMLDLLHPYLDAANVDLKAFRQRTYSRYIGASLQTVLDSLKKIKALGIWVEVTTLLIPGLNDEPSEVEDIAAFIAGELGTDTPWHISRFFPHYKMANTPPTPPESLRTALEAGQAAGLQFIYLGNMHGESNTFCPTCQKLLIRRQGYYIAENHVKAGKCGHCGEKIPGVWN